MQNIRQISTILCHESGLFPLTRLNAYLSSRFLTSVPDESKETSETERRSKNVDPDTFGTLDERFQEKLGPRWTVPRKVGPKEKKPKIFRPKGRSTSDEHRPHQTTDAVREKDRRTVFVKPTMRPKQPAPWDVFGTLAKEQGASGDSDYAFVPVETGVLKKGADGEESGKVRPLGPKMRAEDYAAKIKELIDAHKLREALDVYHTNILKEDHVKPNKPVYNLLIHACGKVGFTRMAFRLYNQMKQRGLQPTESTFTGLFNACANSPWPEDGLRRASHLRQKMEEKGIIPNTINYHAMIKAFGRCNDVLTAFEIVDEMIAKKHALSDQTLCFLLMACAQHKEAGFRFAVEAWRKFRRKRIPPAVFSYNLLLRVARDCNAGEGDSATHLLGAKAEPPPPLPPTTKEKLALDSSDRTDDSSGSATETDSQANKLVFVDRSVMVKDQQILNESAYPSIPDLLAYDLKPGSVIELKSLDTAESRLMVLGGVQGFLSRMVRDKVKPNIKTFTLLMDCIPRTTEAEEAFLSTMEQHKIQPDIDFYNMLIRRRNKRFCLEGAKEVLELIRKRALQPDIVTFGTMAIGCRLRTEGEDFLSQMKECGFRPNVEIMGALLTPALDRQDWFYILYLLKVMKEDEVKPNDIILKKIENAVNAGIETQMKLERGEEVETLYRSKNYKNGFRKFMLYYNMWLKEMPLDYSEDPWEAFRPKLKELGEDFLKSDDD